MRTAALILFLGIALGAFGAHALEETLAANGKTEVWKTAVLYQLIHGVALLTLANWVERKHTVVSISFLIGIALFCGSLYGLSLSSTPAINKILGPITPLGGLAFLFGWGTLFFFPRGKKNIPCPD